MKSLIVGRVYTSEGNKEFIRILKSDSWAKSRAFAYETVGRSSNPGRVIPQTFKMVVRPPNLMLSIIWEIAGIVYNRVLGWFGLAVSGHVKIKMFTVFF